MRRHTHTILARAPLSLLLHSEKQGLDRRKLIEAAGLHGGELDDPDGRIPVARYCDLWQAVVDRLPDETAGVRIGSSYRVREAGLVGYAMLHSLTLGDALRRFIAYGRIMDDSAFVSMSTVGERVDVTIEEAPRLIGMRQPVEYDLAACVTCFREITGVDSIPAEVQVPYPVPAAGTDRHRESLGDVVYFDRPTATIVLRVADLELPIVAADETLCSYLDRHAEDILGGLAAETFPERVRRGIWEGMQAGEPTLRSVAMKLGVSTRSLQRRLQEEELTFAELRERFRERMAAELLQRPDLAVYEVAYLLGYADPAAFYRAFRRWKNVTPRQYRQSIR